MLQHAESLIIALQTRLASAEDVIAKQFKEVDSRFQTLDTASREIKHPREPAAQHHHIGSPLQEATTE